MTEFGQEAGKLVLRVAVGGLLLFHGISKIMHGVAWMHGPLSAYHLPFFIAYGVYVGEVVAPVLVILGVWTRAAGLVISFDILMAFVLVSHVRFFTLSMAGGWALEPDAFFFLTGLAIFFLGAGKLSLAGTKGKWN
jgi:putative oxidoreductase